MTGLVFAFLSLEDEQCNAELNINTCRVLVEKGFTLA